MRRILHEIRLDRIAAVDKPAVEGAVAAILKRADPPPPPECGQVDWASARADALKKLDGLASTIAKRDGLSTSAAYAAALNSPEGARLYEVAR